MHGLVLVLGLHVLSVLSFLQGSIAIGLYIMVGGWLLFVFHLDRSEYQED